MPAVGLAPQLFAVCSDEDFAGQGQRVRLYNLLIVTLAAVTVTLAMRTVGLLLVSALMVVPAAAQNLVRGFYAVLGCAMAIGVLVSVGGAAGVPSPTLPRALIVVLAMPGVRGELADLCAAPATAELRLELPELPGPSRTGPGPATSSGQPRTPALSRLRTSLRQHGDHTDFIHEGHRHAQHADHYDEH